MPAAHLIDILERERTRCQVAGIGILLVALHIELLKILVRDDRLAAYHHMAMTGNGRRNALDGRCKMRDIGAYMAVAARHHLGEPTVVVSHHQSKPIQFPRNPDRPALSPTRQFGRLLGLGQ